MAVQREPLTAPRLGQGKLDRPLTPARCDVLIIGGGPAGLATAIELRRGAARAVVVAEATDAPAERFGETLPPDILLPLERLGLRDAFRDDGHLRCPGSVSLWGGDTVGHNDFILNPLGPAWHISRARFEAMLRARAVQVGAEIRTATRAVAAERTADGFEVVLRHSSGRLDALRAAWVVDASGQRAWFARRQGATRRSLDRLLAVVSLATLRDGALTAQTLVEATPDGWWYAARLPGGRVVRMLMTEPAAARSLTDDGYARWHALLARTRLLAPRLAACVLAEERMRTYAVNSGLLDSVQGERWLAVGDAASVYDPIASQGIYKALADATDACAAIASRASSSRYGERVAARFDDYLANRAHLYALEGRFAQEPFWRRRRVSPAGSMTRGG